MVKTLRQLAEALGEDRQASCSREISKVHEETLRGTLAELASHFEETEPKGEFVIVVAGADLKQKKKEKGNKNKDLLKERE